MGKQNDAMVHFLQKEEVLADLYNGCLYEGRQVIEPHSLNEVQRCYHEDLRDRCDQKKTVRRERDAIRGFLLGDCPVLLAAEPQNNPHLAMPLRCMEYDVEEYVRQLRLLRQKYERRKEHFDGKRDSDGKGHSAGKGLSSGMEYLSGFSREDRLVPVVTIVLYHGSKHWDAPQRLQEMLAMEGLDEKLRTMTADYRIHLFSITELKEENFRTGLRELIGVMKRCRDKEALLCYCNENADRFHQLDDETYDVICTMINAKRLLKQKEKYKGDGKEGNDMCKALNDLMKDSRREGWLEGRIEGEKAGRIEGEKVGRIEGEKAGRIEGEKAGRIEGEKAGRIEGEKAGRIEGEKAGIVKGEIRGEELFGKLASCLLGQKRYSDLEEAAKNAVVRSRLYREFHLRA